MILDGPNFINEFDNLILIFPLEQPLQFPLIPAEQQLGQLLPGLLHGGVAGGCGRYDVGQHLRLYFPHLGSGVLHPQHLVYLTQLLTHRRVELVFYVVVRPALQVLGDALPLVPVALVTLEEQPLLFVRPLRLVDLRVQVVMPSTPSNEAYLSRHCLPVRPGGPKWSSIRWLICDQLWVPCFFTSVLIAWSSWS